MTHALSRPEALRELARHGITGSLVYMLDVLPLVEMMWADGRNQEMERLLVDKFLRRQVDNINELARATVLSYEEATRFVTQYAAERPDPALMRLLRSLIPPVRMSSSDVLYSARIRTDILSWCLDIASACVADYPYGDHDRFCAAEKQCFEEILETLTQPSDSRK